MYQALYRKWRPQTFDEVIGQEHITETLRNQVKTGRLSHAYIFIGTRGTGKTTCARILARAVNCEHPVDGNPCGCCPSCRGIMDGSVMDVVELDAASNNGVENVRALREEAVFSPAAVKKRVYIIDEVHMLSMAAFNALLKVLEEPPEHLLFILATTELQKVPATILSRCQRHSFKRIDSAKLADYVSYVAAQEHFSMTGEAAELIARLADGGVRDALSLLDQCSGRDKIDLDSVYSSLGLAGNRRVAELLDGILAHDTQGVLKLYDRMWMDGKDPATLLTELSGLLRDILMLRVAPKAAADLISGGYDMGVLRSFASRMTAEELLSAMTTVQQRMAGMRDMKNPKTAVELCLVSLCLSPAGDSPAELRARIARLEQQIKDGVRFRPEEPENFSEDELPPPEESIPHPAESYEEPDLPDPAMFAEEQPEDALFDRAAQRPEPAPQEKKQISWQEIVEKAFPTLDMTVRTFIRDGKKVRGTLDGGALKIEAEPSFCYPRLNRQPILQKLADAAGALAGCPVNATVSVLRQSEKKTRDIEELRKFPEVKFS